MIERESPVRPHARPYPPHPLRGCKQRGSREGCCGARSGRRKAEKWQWRDVGVARSRWTEAKGRRNELVAGSCRVGCRQCSPLTDEGRGHVVYANSTENPAQLWRLSPGRPVLTAPAMVLRIITTPGWIAPSLGGSAAGALWASLVLNPRWASCRPRCRRCGALSALGPLEDQAVLQARVWERAPCTHSPG